MMLKVRLVKIAKTSAGNAIKMEIKIGKHTTYASVYGYDIPSYQFNQIAKLEPFNLERPIQYCNELVDMARRIWDVFCFLTMPFCSPPSGLTGPSDITFLRASWLWSLLSLAGGGRLSDWVLWIGRTPAMLCLCCFLAWLDWPLLCAAVAVWVKWKPRVCILRWNQLKCYSCKQRCFFSVFK